MLFYKFGMDRTKIKNLREISSLKSKFKEYGFYVCNIHTESIYYDLLSYSQLQYISFNNPLRILSYTSPRFSNQKVNLYSVFN